MRSFQVFAAMTPERAVEMMKVLHEHSPAILAQTVAAAAASMKTRPVYLKRQPFEKRADAVRRALSRVVANDAASELLAVYFLQCRQELLVEWLDKLGLEHEEGTLKDESPPEPAEDHLRKCVEEFRAAGEEPDRDLLLQAFAAQDAVEWPALDELISS